MSYIFFTASLIFFLSARMSTMKTKVLLSSIFFIADSVVKGYLRIWYWSNLFRGVTLIRGYLGFLSFFNVFGRWNVTDVLIFLAFFLNVGPDFTALAVFKAWALGSAFLVLSAEGKRSIKPDQFIHLKQIHYPSTLCGKVFLNSVFDAYNKENRHPMEPHIEDWLSL